MAAAQWRVARGSWSHEDRDEEQLVEDSRWCQYRGLAAMQEKQRVLGARNRDPIAAGDGGKTDREAVSQGVSRRFDETRAART